MNVVFLVCFFIVVSPGYGISFDASDMATLQSTIDVVHGTYKAATGKDLAVPTAAGNLSLADPGRQVDLSQDCRCIK